MKYKRFNITNIPEDILCLNKMTRLERLWVYSHATHKYFKVLSISFCGTDKFTHFLRCDIKDRSDFIHSVYIEVPIRGYLKFISKDSKVYIFLIEDEV